MRNRREAAGQPVLRGDSMRRMGCASHCGQKAYGEAGKHTEIYVRVSLERGYRPHGL